LDRRIFGKELKLKTIVRAATLASTRDQLGSAKCQKFSAYAADATWIAPHVMPVVRLSARELGQSLAGSFAPLVIIVVTVAVRAPGAKLHRADVDRIANQSCEAALVRAQGITVGTYRICRIARIDGWATRQRCVSQSWPAIVGQGPEHGREHIGGIDDEIARLGTGYSGLGEDVVTA
jgi:hypothetical protein